MVRDFSFKFDPILLRSGNRLKVNLPFIQDVASGIIAKILVWGILLQFNSCSSNISYSLGGMVLFFKDTMYCLNLRTIMPSSPYI